MLNKQPNLLGQVSPHVFCPKFVVFNPVYFSVDKSRHEGNAANVIEEELLLMVGACVDLFYCKARQSFSRSSSILSLLTAHRGPQQSLFPPQRGI